MGFFQNCRLPMRDYVWKRQKRDNDVSPEIESSPYVKVEGLEKKISVPEATREDRRWAKRLKNATSGDVAKALISAIETGQNWRVWYLVNRPLRYGGKLLGKVKRLGFDGEGRVKDGLAKAAEHDNVTAAYLLLKYAEKNRTACIDPKQTPRDEIDFYARNGMLEAAQQPGSDVFTLLAKTFSALTREPPKSLFRLADDLEIMKQAAVRAGAQGNEAHLDAMLNNNLLTPLQFVEAYMASFADDDGESIGVQKRRPFMAWLLRRGIVDQTFSDEAAMVEVRVAAEKEFNRAARAKGWKQSARALRTEEGAEEPPGPAQAEITQGDVTYVFNYAAQRANRIAGGLVQSVAFDKFTDKALLEEGREFLDSSTIDTPQLAWKKGEPFRLRRRP
jgi:hypothetical protein